MLATSTLAVKSARVPEIFPQLPLTLASAAIFALVMAAMYALVGLYRPGTISLAATVGRITLAMGAGGFLTNLAMRAVGVPESLATLILTLVYLGIGLLLIRTGGNVMRRVSPLARVLIVGTGPEAYEIARELSCQGEMSRDVVGLFPSCGGPSAPELSGSGLHVFPENASIPDLVSLHGIQEVIVAVREQRGGGVPMDQLLACRIKGVPVLDFAGFCEKTKRQVPIDSLKGSWLVYGHGFVQGSVRTFVKRLFDIVSSIVLLMLLSPIMIATMIAVPLDSRGPIFYRQRRTGLGGVEFTCLKFRSMFVDSEKDGVARWAVRNDPRTTRVGAFIRKTRIDELPQLFSVLKGEMSLVGPRPERPSFVAQLKDQIPFYDIRHSVKPGVTGWAQVRYHYGATFEDARRKHQFDLYYVKNNSLLLDILILIETVSVVMFREGQ
ncbi:TIGR03013 family PEP-CTERM/XrtA system glycosyltransferase [Comamonadaceae bacterium BS-T2-15]|uniref:TIGR03013 family PEP-CTERM/XrtA system glycosyltransferase n=1 Tax=Scleromatobacter humisilvae TaxID=2897159 RepID=A0A9X1YK90_9BURK|nr:TIGR03013 family PEP-CTERM/XrtA system glycosyltransferase [Scleromatobacter humisilvae]